MSSTFKVTVKFYTALGMCDGVLWWACLSVCLSVCVFACLSASISPELHVRSSPNSLCARCSVLLWRRCDTLCTSGFTNDTIICTQQPYGHVDGYRCSEWRHGVVVRRPQRRCWVSLVVSRPRRWRTPRGGSRGVIRVTSHPPGAAAFHVVIIMRVT